MKVGEMFPSKFLSAPDLRGQTVTVVIESIRHMEVQAGEEHKYVVYFRGKAKGLVLNVTNANLIRDIHGEDSDNWIGKKILLWPTQTEMKGKTVACIRVKLGSTPAIAQAEEFVEEIETAASPVAATTDDDIPF